MDIAYTNELLIILISYTDVHSELGIIIPRKVIHYNSNYETKKMLLITIIITHRKNNINNFILLNYIFNYIFNNFLENNLHIYIENKMQLFRNLIGKVHHNLV